MSREKRSGIICVAAERIFLHGGHHRHWWDAVPLFYALLGFAGGFLLSYGAKFLAKHVIQRKEGYYDGE
jgi:hypothetical protein